MTASERDGLHALEEAAHGGELGIPAPTGPRATGCARRQRTSIRHGPVTIKGGKARQGRAFPAFAHLNSGDHASGNSGGLIL